MAVAIHDTGIRPTLYERYRLSRRRKLPQLHGPAFDSKSLQFVLLGSGPRFPTQNSLIIKVLSSGGRFRANKPWIIRGVDEAAEPSVDGGNSSLSGPARRTRL